MLRRRPTYRNVSLSTTSHSSSNGDSLVLPVPTYGSTDDTSYETLSYSRKRYSRTPYPPLQLPMVTVGKGSPAPTAGTVNGVNTEVLLNASASLPISTQTDAPFDDDPIGLRVRSSPYVRRFPISSALLKEQLRQSACTTSWSSYIASHNASSLALAYGFGSSYSLEPQEMCCRNCYITPYGISLLRVIGPQGSRCVEFQPQVDNKSEVDNKMFQGISVIFLHQKAILLSSL